ncbi:hypothetical protein GCM10025777_55040 [Membranihabitans marinus]
MITYWILPVISQKQHVDGHIHGNMGEDLDNETIYTCSMHPQIRQSEPGQCPICGMDLIPLEQNSSDGAEGYGLKMTPESVQMANIQTAIIGSSKGEIADSIEVYGQIVNDETKSSRIVSHLSGRIDKLYVNYIGDKVNKGQRIASIYSPTLMSIHREILEAKKLEDISPGLLEAAKNKLKVMNISQAVIDQLLTTTEIQSYYDLMSEHSGIVSQKIMAEGDYVSPGSVLLEVNDLTKVWAHFDVYESDLAKFKVGSTIEFKISSQPKAVYKARISFIDPTINPQTRIVTVRAEINNSGLNLKPGMFLRGKVKQYHKSSGLIVPTSAVMWTGKRSVVYIKDQTSVSPSFEYREVELGSKTSKGYDIVGGLAPGEEVVVNGSFVIDAAAQLANKSSMMNKNISIKGQEVIHSIPDYTDETTEEHKAVLKNMVENYLIIKDGLVKDDVNASRSGVQLLIKTVENISLPKINNEVLLHWNKSINDIEISLQKMSTSDDLSEIRTLFEGLSSSLIYSLKVFGISEGKYLIQHCPMVNNNMGGDWLSIDTAIRNPYYGNDMLTCGENIEEIDKNYRSKHINNQILNQQHIH